MKSKHLLKVDDITARQKEFSKRLDDVELCLDVLERPNNVDGSITVEFNSDEMHTLLCCLVDYMKLLETTSTKDMSELLRSFLNNEG